MVRLVQLVVTQAEMFGLDDAGRAYAYVPKQGTEPEHWRKINMAAR